MDMYAALKLRIAKNEALISNKDPFKPNVNPEKSKRLAAVTVISGMHTI